MTMEQAGVYAAGQTIGATNLRVVRRLDGNRETGVQVYLAICTAQPDAPPLVVKLANGYDRLGRPHAASLHNEAICLGKLSHPHVIRLLPPLDGETKPGNYAGRTQEGDYAPLVLEYLTGGSLGELLQRRRGLSGGEAVAIGYALASALDYVHARGLVHLDVAPHNVLFRTELKKSGLPDAVLVDFGSACPIGRHKFAMHETFYASAYLSPEVLVAASAGVIDVQPKIDVYALGAVLYTMLVGEPPFVAKDQRALQDAIMRGASSPLAVRWQPDRSAISPALQQRLDGLVRLAMHREPERRCDAAWMARELYEIGFHLGIWAIADTHTDSNTHGRQRSLLVVLLALGLLVFGAGFGAGVLAGNVLPPITATPAPIATTVTATATGTSTPSLTPTNSVTPTATPTNSATPTAAATATSTMRSTATTRAPTATLIPSPSP